MDGGEVVYFTKGLTKAAKNDPEKAAEEFQKFEDKFKEIRANPEDHRIRADAKLFGYKWFVSLPNDLTQQQTEKLVKAVLADLPKGLAGLGSIHETSNKRERHLHAAFLCNIRPGGYGVYHGTDIDKWRIKNADKIRNIIFKELRSFGYEIQQKQPITNDITPKQKFIFDRMIEKDAARQVIPEDVARRRSELRTSDSWWLEASKNTKLSQQMRDYAAEISRKLTKGNAAKLARPIKLYEHQTPKAAKEKALKEELSPKIETSLENTQKIETASAEERETQKLMDAENVSKGEALRIARRKELLANLVQETQVAETKKEPLKISKADLDLVFSAELEKECNYYRSLEEPVPKNVVEDTLEKIADPSYWNNLARNSRLSEEARDACRVQAEMLRNAAFYERVEILNYRPEVVWSSSEEKPKFAQTHEKALRTEEEALSYEKADEVYAKLKNKQLTELEQLEQRERLRCFAAKRKADKELSDKMKENRLKMTKPKKENDE